MPAKLTMRSNTDESVRHRRFFIWTVLFMLLLVLSALSYIFIPSPPDTLVMSTGIDGGAYAVFGDKYRGILSRENVKVRLLASSGSLENYVRLRDYKARIDVGFVQDGTGSSSEAKNLISLGAICYSPFWVFYRDPKVLDDLSEVKGKRIAIGAPGSGVREIAKVLLHASKADEGATQILDLQGAAANKALLEGKVDVVMIVGTDDNGLVRELLYEPSVKLISFRQAEAYTRLFPRLSHVVLPRGILDLSRKMPSEDVHLLATTTSLIARKDLHPDVVYLLLDAAVEIHGNAGWVNRKGEFPSPKEMDFPSSKYAERFYKSGRPFLLDYLPLRTAVLADRLIIVLLPLAFLIAPAYFLFSTLYSWGNRRKVYRWYRDLRNLEKELDRGIGPEEAQKLLAKLDRIDSFVNDIRLPLAFFPDAYRLKEDVNLVRAKLDKVATTGTECGT